MEPNFRQTVLVYVRFLNRLLCQTAQALLWVRLNEYRVRCHPGGGKTIQFYKKVLDKRRFWIKEGSGITLKLERLLA